MIVLLYIIKKNFDLVSHKETIERKCVYVTVLSNTKFREEKLTILYM